MFKKLEAWILANPGVVHVLEGLLYAVIAADIAYLKPLLSGGAVPQLTVILAGLGSASFIAFKLYVQTTLSQNQGQIIAWAQDLLEQGLTSFVPGQSAVVTPATPTNPPAVVLIPAKPASAALTPLKMILFFWGLSLLASNAMAWELPNASVGLKPKVGALVSGVSPTVQGNNELDLIPTGTLGLGVGPNNTPSYGYSGSWDLVLDHVSQSTTAGVANVVPYFGVGGSLYVDAGAFINSGTAQPVLLDGGLNIIGPQIDDLVPTAEMVWNFSNGTKETLIGFTAPFSLLESVIIPVKQF